MVALSKRAAATIAGVVVAFGWLSSDTSAQWTRYPTPGLPRTADGKVDMSAPTPRTADGKPDLSGFWAADEPDFRRQDQPPAPNDAGWSGRMFLIARDLPVQPWLAALGKERQANRLKDDPHVRCMPLTFLRAYGMPHVLKFVQTPGLLLMLNEWNAGYRQVFTDGRPLPTDPNPSWQGYSSAAWSGDTLIVETVGFRDDLWLDWSGNVLTDAAKVREEIRRPDVGHIEIKVTVDDPKAYTKPWTVLIKERLIVDTELIDAPCLENEKSFQHFK